MPQILIGRDAEQPGPALEAGGQLEIGDISATAMAAQPVLLLGKIVMADAGAMQLAQRLLGGTEIGDVADRFSQMQRYAIDEAADQRAPAGPQQIGTDMKIARKRQRAAFSREQMARQDERPPGYLIEPAQHGINLAAIAA